MVFLPYSLMEDLIDLDKAKVKYIHKPQVCPRFNQRTCLASSDWLSLLRFLLLRNMIVNHLY
jgi:hypothetical protein